MQDELFIKWPSPKVAPAQLNVESDWLPPMEYPRWWDAKEISIDLETFDPDLKSKGPSWGRKGGGRIVGVGVSVRDAAPLYFPWGHGDKTSKYGNLDRNISLRWLRDIAQCDATKYIFNSGYERGWLAEYGIELNGDIKDPSIAAVLLDENRMPGQYNLDSLCQDWLGITKDKKLLEAAANAADVDVMAGLWQLHSKYVGPYGEQDALLNFKLWDYCEPLLEKQNLWQAYDLEAALVPILVEMRRRGVPVDMDEADKLLPTIKAESRAIRKRYKSHGVTLPERENSGPQIAALADSMGLDYPTIPKTGNPSFVKDWMKAQKHPLFTGIMELRECSTIHSLVSSQLSNAVNGRIHCTLNALKSDEGGTVTFRFSSRYPNLQQVPSRGRWGKLVRGIFLPEEGELFCKPDYSQQEYRLMVHYAYAMKCRGARRAADLYNKEGADFHRMTMEWQKMEITEDNRNRAKILNFGMLYAMTKVGVAKQLACSEELAQKVLTEYHRRVPFVKQLTDEIHKEAELRGYVRLMYGHVCHFDRYEPRRYDLRDGTALLWDEAWAKWKPADLKRAYGRKAANKVIQGSGAGMIKKAMVLLAEEKLLAMMQVHDELPFSVLNPEQGALIGEIMESVTQDMLVPVPVDVKLGPNWGAVA